MERLSSGSELLDSVLGGGLVANGINLISGLPGSGKTILAQQFLFRNSASDRPGVYFATVSEPREKMLRFGETLSFFDRGRVGSEVFYEDLGLPLHAGGLSGVLEEVSNVLLARSPGVVVIDSFKALRDYASTEGEFREFLHGMAARAATFACSFIWVGEYSEADLERNPEAAVADSIVLLANERIGSRDARMLHVVKMRGSAFPSGRHYYRIGPDGIEVFPRLADPGDQTAYDVSAQRVSSGIAILDTLLETGYLAGSATLLLGPSGVGKTLMGLHFAFEGARNGEPAVVASLQENSSQLERIAQGFGWTLTGAGVHVFYRSPVDLYVDEWMHDLLGLVKATGAKRVVIDSLGDLRATVGDEVRLREYIYSLLQRLSRQGISLLMTQETPDLFATARLSEFGVSHLSDNVVVLRFTERADDIGRAAVVLKTRGMAHDSGVHEYDIISGKGVVLNRGRRGSTRAQAPRRTAQPKAAAKKT